MYLWNNERTIFYRPATGCRLLPEKTLWAMQENIKISLIRNKTNHPNLETKTPDQETGIDDFFNNG
jgi:hypothetical protein